MKTSQAEPTVESRLKKIEEFVEKVAARNDLVWFEPLGWITYDKYNHINFQPPHP